MTPEQKTETLEEIGTWLSEPLKVLGAISLSIVLGCLVAGFMLTGITGFVFAYIGTVGLLQLRRFK